MLKDFFTTLGTGALNKVLHAVLVLVIGLLIIRVVTKLLQGGTGKIPPGKGRPQPDSVSRQGGHVYPAGSERGLQP